MTKTTYRGRGRPRKTDDGQKSEPGIRTLDQQRANSTKNKTRKKKVRGLGGGRTRIRTDSYVHQNEKRKNIPETGIFADFKDNEKSKKYQYDPNADPTLNWAGKEEQQEFDVNIVPLHMHERVDPMTIIANLTKSDLVQQSNIVDFFDDEQKKLSYSKAIDFYKHEYGWANRIIAGDSLDIMNSLIEKEGMEGKVKMVYIDPPYGINYNSNFQSSLKKDDVSNNDNSLSKDPETIKAFRDTWELGIHSYLTYMRNRINLAKILLQDDGSIFIQISDDNVHRIRLILDEIFGAENFISQISFQKTTQSTDKHLSSVFDIILWYAKNKKQLNTKKLFRKRTQEEINKLFNKLDIGNEKYVGIVNRTKYKNAKQFMLDNLYSNHYSATRSQPYTFNEKKFIVPKDKQWSVSFAVMDKLAKKNRLIVSGKTLMFKKYYDDFTLTKFTNVWTDTLMAGLNSEKIYVVQTYSKVIQRCMLMATNPGDLIFDPTCGSGTTAVVAEQFGRRWITCDTSQVAISLVRMRLMSVVFDYYKLKNIKDGVCGGFQYETVERKTKKSIAGITDDNNYIDSEEENIHKHEILYDRPFIDQNRKRISGPFTIESSSPPIVESLDNIYDNFNDGARKQKFKTQYQDKWRIALKAVGITGRIKIKFDSLETHSKSKLIHAVGITIDFKKTAVSFGPEYGTMDTRQIQHVREEIRMLNEKFDIVIFAAMQFDPAVQNEISNLNSYDKINETFYIVDINKDLMNHDLKSPRSNNSATFWMIGQPDIELKKTNDLYVVEVKGFDYMDPKTGEMSSGNTDNIAMWYLDTNYDGRCMYPRQVYFPMADSIGQKLYKKMQKNLKSIIDPDKLESYKGTKSLPFKPGGTDSNKKQIAIKIIDEAGRETMKVLDID